MADSIVLLPPAHAAPSKGQLAIVVSAGKKKYKSREIDAQSWRANVNRGIDLERFISFLFLCVFFLF